MGCMTSTEGDAPRTILQQEPAGGEDGGVFNDDQEFKGEYARKRTRYNKKDGGIIEDQDSFQDDDVDDFFEPLEAGQGEQFMAVRPYIGAIFEPTNHNPVNKTPPDVMYNLEYIYGYDSQNSRQNLFFNSSGQVVYSAAAVGVIMDTKSNSQRFFGGQASDNKHKTQASDESYHTNDILSLAISSDRGFAATGQNGAAPVAFVWDSNTGKKIQRFKLLKGSRGISAIGISQDGSFVAFADLHNDHNVYVYECKSGKQMSKQKGGPDKIFGVNFSAQANSQDFVSVGTKHIRFWNTGAAQFKKGIFGGKGELTSFGCAAWDDQGVCFTGGANGHIYEWRNKMLNKVIKSAHTGFVGALRWQSGTLLSGGKDGNVNIYSHPDMQIQKTVNFGSLIRGIDINGTQLLVSVKAGTIFQMDTQVEKQVPIMESHSDGEVWGLCPIDDRHILTSCDDNSVRVWDWRRKTAAGKAKISDTKRKAPKGGASSLSQLPASQQSRAVAFCHATGHVAVAQNDGHVTIRAGADQVDNVMATLTESKEWVEAMEYSPNGDRLAVGSHDNNIYIYESNNYKLLGILQNHNSFIVSVDWSTDGNYIRSICGAHELLFFNSHNFSQETSGGSNTVGTQWQTNSAKYGWSVEGIFPSGTDGTHINGVDWSSDGNLIASGDDYGLVNVFRNPCRSGAKPLSLRGHSEHVVRVRFHDNDSVIFSIGGYDQCLMQWRRG